MVRLAVSTILAMAVTSALPQTAEPQTLPAPTEVDHQSGKNAETRPTQLRLEQKEIIDWAFARFNTQGLELPEIDFVFHHDLLPCNGHKGMFHKSSQTLEMCSMDPHTMLHELAHAWANENLSKSHRQDFVRSRGLDSWNDHDDSWERRGTEHVAETIAWALADSPRHVKWVETLPDGSTHTTHQIVTIGVDVDTLLNNFKDITGMEPIFRHAHEWAIQNTAASTTSADLKWLGN